MARRIEVELIGDSKSLERAFGRSSRSAKEFNRDLGKATRGVAAGSGVFRGLGRSLAFASGGFLAFASVSDLLRKSVDAAVEQAQTQKQLAAQFRASGLELKTYNKQIEETTGRLSLLSGFQDDELKRSFTTAFRGTKDVTASLRLEAVAADVARGTHKDLSVVTLALTKGYLGQATALRRLGILLPANAKGMQLLNLAAAKFAGQARAGTTAQQRLAAVFHNTEEIIGGALLPTINRLTTQFTLWLHRMNETGELQRRVNLIVKDTSQIVHGLAEAFRLARSLAAPFVQAVGGLKNAAELAGIAFLTLRANALAAAFGLRFAGTSAVVAEGQFAALTTGLTALTAAPWIITVAVLIKDIKDPNSISRRARQLRDVIKKGGPVEQGLESLPTVGPVIAALNRGLNVANDGKKPTLGADTAHPSRGGGESPGGPSRDPIVRARKQQLDDSRGRLGLIARFAKLELALAQAQLTKTERDDRKILALEIENLRDQLKRRKLSLPERTALTNQLAAVEQRAAAIDEQAAARVKQSSDKQRVARNKAHDVAVKALKDRRREAQQQAREFRDLIQTERARIGELFAGPVFAPTEAQQKHALGAPTPGSNVKSLVADLKAQIGQFKAFGHDLQTLAKRGAPPQLLAELRQQGIAVAPQVHALATASGGTLAQFKGLFAQREQLAVRAAKQERPVVNLTVIVNKDTGAVRVKTTPHGQNRGRHPGVVIDQGRVIN